MAVLYFQNKCFPKVRTGDAFDREAGFQHDRGVAFMTDRGFFASGLNEGGSVHSNVVSNPTLPGLKDWVAKSFGDPAPVESPYEPGTRFKRMWRPSVYAAPDVSAAYQEQATESFVSLRILLNRLDSLFETISPTQENLPAYGHKIREIILLACMEVESSWSAVLRDNAYPSRGRLTTKHYVKLLKPMLLDGYELHLQSYPAFPSFSPFAGWSASNPTGSLGWYDAYNKTKHDRERNLKHATLESAVHSVGAAVVMFHAQFGLGGTGDQRTPAIRNIFRTITTGFRKYEKEYYVPTLDFDGEFNRVPSGKWILLDYTSW